MSKTERQAERVTGHPPGMLQDDSRELTAWLAGKPDAMRHARDAVATIRAERVSAADELTTAGPDGCGRCHTCAPNKIGRPIRMIVCPECGNKRCPKANDCRNACTGSNEPGQPGSAYPAAQKTTERPGAAHRARLEATPEGRALLSAARAHLRECLQLTPEGVEAFTVPTAAAMEARPCRCGPDGCADSGCPGRGEG